MMKTRKIGGWARNVMTLNEIKRLKLKSLSIQIKIKNYENYIETKISHLLSNAHKL